MTIFKHLMSPLQLFVNLFNMDAFAYANFIYTRYLVDKGVYDLERVRSTAKAENIASNKLLMKNNFTKSKDMVDDGYSPENEYFYYFEK